MSAGQSAEVVIVANEVPIFDECELLRRVIVACRRFVGLHRLIKIVPRLSKECPRCSKTGGHLMLDIVSVGEKARATFFAQCPELRPIGVGEVYLLDTNEWAAFHHEVPPMAIALWDEDSTFVALVEHIKTSLERDLQYTTEGKALLSIECWRITDLSLPESLRRSAPTRELRA